MNPLEQNLRKLDASFYHTDPLFTLEVNSLFEVKWAESLYKTMYPPEGYDTSVTYQKHGDKYKVKFHRLHSCE